MYNRKKMLNKIAQAKSSEDTPEITQSKLVEQNDKNSFTIDGDSIPNYNGLLEESRGEGQSKVDVTTEGQMNKNADRESKDITTEGQINDRKSWFPHRQNTDDTNMPMTPIAALHTALDEKNRKMYSDAENKQKKTKRIVDKDIGKQSISEFKKIPNNVPPSGSQLSNNSERYKSLSASKKEEYMIKLQDADAMLFFMYHKAQLENRSLNPFEQSVEQDISKVKEQILNEMGGESIGDGHNPGDINDINHPQNPQGHPNSEFYDMEQEIDEPFIPVDPSTVNDMNQDPAGGIGGEDLNNPHYRNIHMQEQQELDNTMPSNPNPTVEMIFNYKKYKESQNKGRFPPETMPDPSLRGFRFKEDPYRLDNSPGDGNGYKMTTPGSEGMIGDAPDMGSSILGTNDRSGYPDNISQISKDVNKSDIPHDSDPDSLYNENSREEGETHYNTGPSSDNGLLLADDLEPSPSDSPLGTANTVLRQQNGNRDRKTDINIMNGTVKYNPFEEKIKRNGPMNFIKERRRNN